MPEDKNKKPLISDENIKLALKTKSSGMLTSDTGDSGPLAAAFGDKDFGESKFDDDNLSSTYIKNDEYQYIRGQKQSNWDKAAHGITRGVGAAAQTLADGTVGIGYGLIKYSSDVATDELNKAKYKAEHGTLEGFKPASWTTIFDNEVTRKGEELIKDLEGEVPLYNTREYEEASGIEKLKYMNFWMDDVVKGIGTTVGSMPLGGMGSKLFNAIGKNFVAGKLANGVKTALTGTENLEKVLVDQAKKIKIYNATDKLTASAFASVSEAGMEARGTGDKLREQLLSQITANGTRQPTQAELDWVEMTVDDAKKAAFGTNMAIISSADFFTFGKYMVSNKSAKYLDDIEKVTSKTNVDAGKYINRVAKDGSKLGTDYTATELSKSKKIYDAVTKATKRVIGTNLGEGIEENLQTATDWGVIDFAKQKYYGKQDAESFLHSLGAAYEGSTSSEGVESFLAGFISGGISNTILSKGQNIKEAFSKDPVVNNALKEINLYNTQSVMGELMKGVAEQQVAGNRMDNAKDDTFRFNNAQSDLATSYVLSRIKTGKFEDLQNDLDELKTMPVEEVEKLFGVKIGEGGKTTVIDYIQGKVEQAKQIKQIHDASYVVFPEGSVSDNNRDRLIHANVSILDTQKRIKSINKDFSDKGRESVKTSFLDGTSTVDIESFNRADGTVVNYNLLEGTERAKVKSEIIERLNNTSVAPIEIPGMIALLDDLDKLKVRHAAYKDIYNSLLNPKEAEKLDKEDVAIEQELVKETEQKEKPVKTDIGVALMAAQEEAEKTGGVPEVSDAQFEDPQITTANAIIEKIGTEQIDNPMFDASGNFNTEAVDPTKKEYPETSKELTVNKEVISGQDMFNRTRGRKTGTFEGTIHAKTDLYPVVQEILTSIFNLPQSNWKDYIKIIVSNKYAKSNNTNNKIIPDTTGRAPFNFKAENQLDTSIILIDPTTGNELDLLYVISPYMFALKEDTILGGKSYKAGESVEIDKLSFEEASKYFTIHQNEELTEEEFEALKLSYKEIVDLRKALLLFYEANKKNDGDKVNIPSEMFNVSALWTTNFIQENAVEYPAISTIPYSKDTDGKYVIYQGGTVQKFLIGTDTKVGDINNVPNGSGVYMKLFLPDGSNKWIPIKSAKVKPAIKVWERIQNAAEVLSKIPQGNKEEAYQVIKDLSLYAASKGKLDFSYGWNTDLNKYTLRFNVGDGLGKYKSIDMSEGVSATDKTIMLDKNMDFFVNRINHYAEQRKLPNITVDSFREDTPIEPSNKPIADNFVSTATGVTPTNIKIYPANLVVEQPLKKEEIKNIEEVVPTKTKVDDIINKNKNFENKGISRKKKGGAHKTGRTTKTPIDLQKALNYLNSVLPAGIKVEMSHVAEKLSNGDMLWGFFSDSVLKLNALAEAGTEFHEAFHAVFRSVLSDKQIDTYLSVAKKEMNLSVSELKSRKDDLRSLYEDITEQELEDLVYEEYLADKFQAWKKDKSTSTAVVNKGLFRRLLDFAKEFLGIKSKVDSLFEAIDTGYYAGKDAVINRFTSNPTQIAYKSLPGKTIAETRDIIRTIAASVTNDIKVEDAINAYIQSFSPEANLSEKKSIQALLADEYEYLSHPEIYKQIMQGVASILTRYKYNVMTESFEEAEESENGIENWQFDHFEVGGVDLLDQDVRTFLALTLYETKDKYGRTVKKAVDLDNIYNTIITNLIDTAPSEFLTKLKVLSKYNVQMQAVVAKIENATKDKGLVGEQLFKKLQKGFERTKMNYLTIRSVSNGESNIFNSNYKSPEKKLFNSWANTYIGTILPKLSDKKYNKEITKKLVEITKTINANSTTVGKAKIPLTDYIIDTLTSIGIEITSGTVDLFFTPNIDNNLDMLHDQYKDLDKPLSGFFSHLAELISKGDPLYKGSLETGKEGDIGFVKQLMSLAIADKHFRSDLFESSFQDARNKNRYSFIMQSYLSDTIVELKKGLSTESAVKEKQENSYFKNSPIFKLFTPNAVKEVFKDLNLLFTGDLIEVEEQTFEGKKSFKKDERVDGVTAKNIKAKEYLLMQLILFSEQSKDSKTGLNKAKYVIGVEEAKSQIYALDLPVLNNVVNESGKISEDGIRDIYNSLFSQEIDRLLVGSPAKWKGFAYFDGLNDREKYSTLYSTLDAEYDKKGNIIKVNKINNNDLFKQEAYKAIETLVNEEIEQTISIAKDYNLDNRLKVGITNYGKLEKLIGSAVINDFLMTSSVDQLVDGDLSNYKNIIDKYKRNGGRNAAGINRSGRTINIAYTSEVKEKKEISGDAEINVDDAQVQSTVRDRINMLEDFARLTPEIKDILERIDNPPIVNGKPQFITEQESAKIDIVSAKLVSYGKDNAGNLIYHKMSVFPLTKEFTSRYNSKTGLWEALPGREKLHNKREWMEKNGIDQIVPLSASKLFSPSNVIDHNEFNSTSFDTNNSFGYKDKNGNLKPFAQYDGKYQRLQVENESGSTEIVNGTQKIQLITSGLDMTKDANKNDVKSYYDILAKLRQTLFDDALSILSTNKEGTNRRKDISIFLNKLLKNAESSGSNFILEQFLAEEGGDFKYDPNLPHLLSQFEKYFLAHFNKGTLIQKTTGNKLTLVTADGIKVTRDSHGKIIPAESLAKNPSLAVNGFEDLRIHKMENGKLQYAEVLMTRRSAEMLGLKVGDELTEDELRTMLGTRIPSQSQHSMMPFKVVDFLPDYYGDSIIGPKELVWLSGADFDIDKLYVYRKNKYLSKSGKTVIFGKGDPFEEYILSKQRSKIFKDAYSTIMLSSPTFSEFQELHKKRIQLLAVFKEALVKSKKEDIKALAKGIENLDAILNTNIFSDITGDNTSLKEERKKAQLIFDSIKDDLNKYLDIAGVKELKDINTRIQQFTEAYEADTMDELGFASTKEEWSSSQEAVETLQNKLLDLELSLLDRPELEEALKTPASVDTLKDIANTLTSVSGTKPEKSGLSLGLLSKFFGKKSIDIGRENIGIAANGNIVNSWLTTNLIHLKNDYAIRLDGKTYSSFEFVSEEDILLNEDGTLKEGIIRKHKSDTISTELSAATDNAKEQLAALVNRSSDILNGLLVWQSLGLGQTRTTIMSVQPIMMELTKMLELTKSNIDKNSVKKGTAKSFRAKDVAQSMLDELMFKFHSKVEEERKLMNDVGVNTEVSIDYSLNTNRLLDIYKKGEATSSDDIMQQIAVLNAYIKAMDINDANTKLLSLLKVNKGVGSELDGLNTIEENYNNLKDPNKIPYGASFVKAFLHHPNILGNKKMSSTIKRVSSEFFIRETESYRRFENTFKRIFGGRNSREATKGTKDFLTFINLRIYEKVLSKVNEDSNFSLSSLNRIAYPNIDNNNKTIIDTFNSLLSKKEFADNDLVKWLNVRNASDNFRKIDLLTVDTRSKLSNDILEKFNQSLNDMYNSEDTAISNFALDVFDYLVVEGNLKFTNESLIKFIGPQFFNDISDNLRELTSAFNVDKKVAKSDVAFNDKIKELTGYNFDALINMYTELYARSSKTAKNLLNINQDDFKSAFDFSIKEKTLKIKIKDIKLVNQQTYITVDKEGDTILGLMYPRFIGTKGMFDSGVYKLVESTDFEAVYEKVDKFYDLHNPMLHLSPIEAEKLSAYLSNQKSSGGNMIDDVEYSKEDLAYAAAQFQKLKPDYAYEGGSNIENAPDIDDSGIEKSVTPEFISRIDTVGEEEYEVPLRYWKAADAEAERQQGKAPDINDNDVTPIDKPDCE